MEGGNSSSRWPRQETLTLIDIRSRLDHKFKEANHKGPLWDEVSRVMGEEHGYQRSGKKCREKFENLYKYYKKTKGGKAGRQDGKHYRFFCQLEALYGKTSINQASVSQIHLVKNNNGATNDCVTNQANQEALQDQEISQSFSLSNSSQLETSSSENINEDDLSAIAFAMNRSLEKKKRINERWKAKMDFVDSHIRKLMETQEAWMEKMVNTIEHKEEKMMIREEEWRKQEAARLDQEFRFWAEERAWVEARDTALMEALQKFTRKEVNFLIPKELIAQGIQDNNSTNQSNGWHEPEILSLIQLRTGMDPRFRESEYLEEGLWEEIAAKMACWGYDWSGIKCKDIWENNIGLSPNSNVGNAVHM